jgi:hypothetical protein
MCPLGRQIIQIVPQLKPGRCGISDHAVALADALDSGFGVTSAFVVLNSKEACDFRFPRIYCPPSQLLEACVSLSKVEAAPLLLHYSGYGYSPDGAPLSLPGALKSVKEAGLFRVGVYFHELFATSKPWRKAFWHSYRQRRVVRALVKECDFMATSLEIHSGWLRSNAMQRTSPALQRLPVFSNVGESREPLSMRRRQHVMVVFGLPGTRQRSYTQLASLGSMLDALGVEEILDIGFEFDAPSRVNGLPVRHMGILSVTDIARILSESMFGFVPHPWFCLAKSGIFAGLCAHGTIPTLGEAFSGGIDGLEDGVHVVSPKTAKEVMAGSLERCSAAGWQWYMGHSLHIHAQTYTQLLLQAPMEGGVN